MSFPAPFDRFEGMVRPEWIDANGHMNLAYYVVLFDSATDAIFEPLGHRLELSPRHRQRHLRGRDPHSL